MIGVYVGSFNPPHLGHIKIVNYLLKKHLNKVIIIPTGNYWNKFDLIELKHRINMLKLFENDKIIIDNQNNSVKYTYELLRILKKEYKNDILYLIIGADNIINFDKWKNYKELLTYHLIILNRDNININSYLNKLGKKDKYIITHDLPNIDISSTTIRKLLKEGNTGTLRGIINDKVLDYIKENNLYKGENK